MDITAHPRLDPKLKDTYDRIMGTSVGVKTPSNTHSAPKPEPVQKKEPEAEAHPQNHKHLSHLSYSALNPKKEVPVKASLPTTPTKTDRENSLLFPIIMGAGGVIFFVFYAIFWISFFGI